jgi:SPP1 family predicted phage head-tail adaptor
MTGISKLPAGLLRTETKLQKYDTVTLPSGNRSKQWADVDTVYVQVYSLVGAGLYYASQHNPKINVHLKMRYREDVKIGMRFVTDTHYYTVMEEPTDIGAEHITLIVMCQQLQATAP